MLRELVNSFSLLEVLLSGSILVTLIGLALTTFIDTANVAALTSERLVTYSLAEAGFRPIANEIRETKAEYLAKTNVTINSGEATAAIGNAILIASPRNPTTNVVTLEGANPIFATAILYVPVSQEGSGATFRAAQVIRATTTAIDPKKWPYVITSTSQSSAVITPAIGGTPVTVTFNATNSRIAFKGIRNFATSTTAGVNSLNIELKRFNNKEKIVVRHSVAVRPDA